MASWGEFAAENPALAEHGHKLFNQFGIGLGYLATVAPDGFPRIHPFCPVLSGERLYGFILGESPKRRDLERDPRCAIHTFAAPELDDEFYLAARAMRIDDPKLRASVLFDYLAPAGNRDDEVLFEFDLVRAMGAEYDSRPSWPPRYTTWHSTD